MCECAWRDIKTAPKDGTAVIAFLPDACYTIDIVAWDWDGRGWKAWCHARCVDGLGAGVPTHWMPLPDPPAKEQP